MSAEHAAGQAAEHAHGALSRKVGPLPAGVWLLAVAGGLAVAVFVRRNAAGEPINTAATDGTGDFGNGLDNTQPGVGGGYVVPSNPTATDVTDAGPQTNDEWQQRAVVKLIGRGYNPLTVSNALDAWLNGVKLTAAQAAIVDEALRVMGGPPPVTPPQPDGGQTNTPTPTPATPAPPAKPPTADRPVTTKPYQPGTAVHSPAPIVPAPSHPVQSLPSKSPAKPSPARPTQAAYTVRAGDTLAHIASAHHTTTSKLYGKNKAAIEKAAKAHGKTSSGGGHWLYPGTVLVLP